MRAETRKVVSAFIGGTKASGARSYTNGTQLYLFDNLIAWWATTEGNKPDFQNLFITFAGWPSPTTKDRINAIFDMLNLGRPFFTDKQILYFCEKIRPVDPHEVMHFDVLHMQRERNAA